MSPTQTTVKTDLYTQIQEIISLGLKWSELTTTQQTLFANPLLLASLEVKSNLEAFNYLTSQTKILEPSLKTGSTVNAALLEDLVNQMNTSIAEEKELKTALSKYSPDLQKTIEQLVAIKANDIYLEELQKKQDLLNEIKPEVEKADPKQTSRQEIAKTANQVIQSLSEELTPAQKIVAVEKLVTICLTSDLDFKNPKELNLATSIALGKNKLYKEISQAISPATDQDYLNPSSSKIINPQTGITIDTSKLSSLTQIKTPHSIKVNPNNNDLGDTIDIESKKLRTAIENNPAALKISHQLSQADISNSQIDEIIHAVNQVSPGVLQTSSANGEKAAAMVEQNPKSDLSPQAIKLYGIGLRPETLALSQTTLTPRQTYALNHQLNRIRGSNLGKEIFTPLSQAGQALQTVTNRVVGKLPEKIAKPLNFALHPVQSAKGFLGRKAGQYLGRKIYKAFAKRVTNKTARLVAKTLLRQGLKEGTKFLVKLGIKGGLELAAQAANVVPGLGIILAIGIEIVWFVGEKTIGFIYNGIQSVAQSLWGEKIKARDLLALPAMAIVGISSTLAGLGAATVAAAGSAGATIIISAVAGIFIYITAFTVAPLISTIAQLEMQPANPFHLGSPGDPSDPNYTPPVPTGPIPPGCPSGWPTASGYITQGPKTGSTHYGSEAIDIGVGMGTPIYATHPGIAVAGGSSSYSYGYYVDVYGICQGVKFATRYAHMPSMAFVGERTVIAGEQIGVVNNTGNSTGSHLHYDIRGGALGDINQFLPKPVMRGCVEYSSCQVDIP